LKKTILFLGLFIILLFVSLLLVNGQTVKNLVIDTDTNSPAKNAAGTVLEIATISSIKDPDAPVDKVVVPTVAPQISATPEPTESNIAIPLPTRDPVLLEIAQGKSQEIDTTDLLLASITPPAKSETGSENSTAGPANTSVESSTGPTQNAPASVTFPPTWTSTPTPAPTTIVIAATAEPTIAYQQPTPAPPAADPGDGPASHPGHQR
jgi:hypothetical protein